MADGSLISVVIPTWERHAALRSCLASLLAQDCVEPLEVIVVNDGGWAIPRQATDFVQERMRLTVLDVPHGGPGRARNAGVAASHGSILAFTDDDCTAHPGWLRNVSRALSARPNAAVGGRVVNALTENPYSRASHYLIEFLYMYYHEEKKGALPFFTTNNLAMRRETFASVGGFDPDFSFASEDRDWSDRHLERGGELAYTPEAVVYHAHELGLGAFLAQHYRYGLGARLFHRSRSRRRDTNLRLEDSGFYRGMLSAPLRAGDPAAWRVMSLIFTSQIVGALGWAVAGLGPDTADTSAR
ncbi:MAG: glycosyltransferase [Gemmatimonadota bacterium]